MQEPPEEKSCEAFLDKRRTVFFIIIDAEATQTAGKFTLRTRTFYRGISNQKIGCAGLGVYKSKV